MTKYTSIRVTQEAKEAAEASKRDGETWNEYLQRCTDNPPEVREYVDADAIATGDVTLDAITDAVAARNMTLEADERTKIAREVAEELR